MLRPRRTTPLKCNSTTNHFSVSSPDHCINSAMAAQEGCNPFHLITVLTLPYASLRYSRRLKGACSSTSILKAPSIAARITYNSLYCSLTYPRLARLAHLARSHSGDRFSHRRSLQTLLSLSSGRSSLRSTYPRYGTARWA